jgi:proteasome lid subunit RPN8/RPN11
MTSASPYSKPEGDRTSASPETGLEEQALDGSTLRGRTLRGRTLAPELAGLPEEVSPLVDGSHQLHGERPPAGLPVVLISQLALRQVESHAQSNLQAEVGGALLGRVYRSDDQTLVEIGAALPAVSHDHGPVHFTFTADAWSQLHRDRERHHPELTIIGWFHSHPDLGVFFSADDVVVHSAAFVLPWHVALVVDPVRGEGCFFGWQADAAEREIVPLPGFFELLDEEQDSVLPWRLTPWAQWQEAGRLLRRAGRVVLPASEWPALPPITPWWGVLMGGLSLLISLILLLERLLQR